MMMHESRILEDINTNKVAPQYRYFKAKVVKEWKADETDASFENAIHKQQTIVFTDKTTFCINIADYAEYIS
jgi:hypothetical protein